MAIERNISPVFGQRREGDSRYHWAVSPSRSSLQLSAFSARPGTVSAVVSCPHHALCDVRLPGPLFPISPHSSLSNMKSLVLHCSSPPSRLGSRQGMQTHLQYILPDLWHFGEELQREYCAYDAEAAEGDATVVAANQPFSSPMTSDHLFVDV